jgi:predicted RNA-binding protein with PIN domain
VADGTLYLFDGYNLLHAGPYDDPRGLADALASFVAERGATGVLVFDGIGDDVRRGPLEIRHASPADTLLERLAVEHRDRSSVILVTSDTTVAAAAGRAVQRLSSQTFFRDLPASTRPDEPRGGLAGKLDPDTRARLERLRRGE